MNAQQLIDICDIFKFDRAEFRKEMNVAWLVSDAIKAYNAINVEGEVKNGN